MQFTVSTLSGPCPLVPGSARAVRLHSRLTLATHHSDLLAGAAPLAGDAPFPSLEEHQAKQAAYSARRKPWLAEIGWKGGEE